MNRIQVQVDAAKKSVTFSQPVALPQARRHLYKNNVSSHAVKPDPGERPVRAAQRKYLVDEETGCVAAMNNPVATEYLKQKCVQIPGGMTTQKVDVVPNQVISLLVIPGKDAFFTGELKAPDLGPTVVNVTIQSNKFGDFTWTASIQGTAVLSARSGKGSDEHRGFQFSLSKAMPEETARDINEEGSSKGVGGKLNGKLGAKTPVGDGEVGLAVQGDYNSRDMNRKELQQTRKETCGVPLIYQVLFHPKPKPKQKIPDITRGAR